MSNGKNKPPGVCPYCGEQTDKLPDHLPCEAVPPTNGYENAN